MSWKTDFPPSAGRPISSVLTIYNDREVCVNREFEEDFRISLERLQLQLFALKSINGKVIKRV